MTAPIDQAPVQVAPARLCADCRGPIDPTTGRGSRCPLCTARAELWAWKGQPSASEGRL